MDGRARAHAHLDNDRASPARLRAPPPVSRQGGSSTPRTPETLLYNYLTVRVLTAPRWYQEGSAVFMETWNERWCRPRARWLRRDVVPRDGAGERQVLRPVGLVSKGTRSTSRRRPTAYLYGTASWITGPPLRPANGCLPGGGRDADSRRYYAHDFRRVSGLPLDESWHSGSTGSTASSGRTCLRCASNPVTEYRDLTKKDLGAVSRTYLSADGDEAVRGCQVSGQLAHIASIGRSDGRVTEIKEVRAPAVTPVTSLAYDQRPGRSSTQRTTTPTATSRGIELRSGNSRTLLRPPAIGDIVYNPPIARCGAYGSTTDLSYSCESPSLQGVADVVRLPRGRGPSILIYLATARSRRCPCRDRVGSPARHR